MMTGSSIFQLHAERNRAIVIENREKMAQFGLLPIDSPGSSSKSALAPGISQGGTIWAWQPGSSDQFNNSASSIVRAGFNSRNLHLGHVGLARDVASFQARNVDAVLFVGSDAKPSVTNLIQLIISFGGIEPEVVDADGKFVRRFEDQLLSRITWQRLTQVYGWGSDTRLERLRDVAMMMSFMMYGYEQNPSIALVDIHQAPHTAIAKTAATRAALSLPTMAYRRLLPSLRTPGERMSRHRRRSTIFMDGPPEETRRTFLAAATGGRATAAQQRAIGGDPVRCPTFEVIELLCERSRAEETLWRCRSGDTLCTECKASRVDEIVSALEPYRRPTAATPALQAGRSPTVEEAVRLNIRRLHRPPPRDPAQLERAIADYAGVAPEQVVVGNGTTEVLDWVVAEQARHAGSLMTGRPTFELYEKIAARHGLPCRTVAWDMTTGSHRLSTMAAEVDGGAHNLCLIDVPHSVSGVAVSLSEVLTAFTPRLGAGAKLIVDNVYNEFMSQPLALTSDFVEHNDELVVCRSLSKAHCLLGARIGYAITNSAYAAKLRRHRLPYGVSSLSVAAARAALADHSTLSRNVLASRRAKTLLTTELDRREISYFPSEANFVLIKLGGLREYVIGTLRSEGIRYRDGRRWRLPSMIQVQTIDAHSTGALIDVLTQV